MKFGKVVEQSYWSFPKVELSDPPIYSVDRRSISSKDGMLWVPVAPNAAAAPGAFRTTATSTICTSLISGAAPAPGPYIMWTFKGSSDQQ